jgi:molecular chaperone HtpG
MKKPVALPELDHPTLDADSIRRSLYNRLIYTIGKDPITATDRDRVYAAAAETFNAAKNSPHLEVFRKKGIEVILLSDRVDEWVVSHLTEFDGKQLVSVAKGGLDLGKLEDEAEKKEQESAAGEFKELTEKIARSLGERAKEVRVTHRLTDGPACLVADDHDVSGNLARILKAAGQKAASSTTRRPSSSA